MSTYQSLLNQSNIFTHVEDLTIDGLTGNTLIGSEDGQLTSVSLSSQFDYTSHNVSLIGFGDLTTTDLTEGDNLYFTNARVDDHLSATTPITYAGGTIAIDTNGDLQINDLSVNGNLVVSGTTTTVNSETVEVKDNLLVLNSGETGAGVSNTLAGIEVDRGTANRYQFLFDESSDTFRVGETGATQAVATRADSPNDNGISTWDDATSSFITNSGFSFDGGTQLKFPANVQIYNYAGTASETYLMRLTNVGTVAHWQSGQTNLQLTGSADATLNSLTLKATDIYLPEETANCVMYLDSNKYITTSSNLTWDGSTLYCKGDSDGGTDSVVLQITPNTFNGAGDKASIYFGNSNARIDGIYGSGFVFRTSEIFDFQDGTVRLSAETAGCVPYLDGSKNITTSGNLAFDGSDITMGSGYNTNIYMSDANWGFSQYHDGISQYHMRVRGYGAGATSNRQFQIHDTQTDTSRFTVNYSDGKVGIGTSTPDSALHIANGTWGDISVTTPIASLELGEGTSGVIKLDSYSVAPGRFAYIQNINGTLAIDSNNIYSLTLNEYVTGDIKLCYGGGNVGIGKTPRTNLDVEGNIYTTWGGITDNFIGAYYDSTYMLGINAKGNNRELQLIAKGLDGSGNITFLTGSGTEQMTLNSSGNLSIGTDSIVGTLNVSESFFLRTAGSQSWGLLIQNVSNWPKYDSTYHTFRDRAGMKTIMSLTGDGTNNDGVVIEDHLTVNGTTFSHQPNNTLRDISSGAWRFYASTWYQLGYFSSDTDRGASLGGGEIVIQGSYSIDTDWRLVISIGKISENKIYWREEGVTSEIDDVKMSVITSGTETITRVWIQTSSNMGSYTRFGYNVSYFTDSNTGIAHQPFTLDIEALTTWGAGYTTPSDGDGVDWTTTYNSTERFAVISNVLIAGDLTVSGTTTSTHDSISVDTINEKTASNGVSIDGVLCKDNDIECDAIDINGRVVNDIDFGYATFTAITGQSMSVSFHKTFVYAPAVTATAVMSGNGTGFSIQVYSITTTGFTATFNWWGASPAYPIAWNWIAVG